LEVGGWRDRGLLGKIRQQRFGGFRGVGWDEMELEVVELPYRVTLGRVDYTLLSTPVVSAATSAGPFCRGSFDIFAV